MKHMRSMRKVRGVTLIEMLISVAIGLVVIGAVIVSFVGSGTAGRYQAAVTQMNQDAQIGLNMLSREVQLAGYSAPTALIDSNAGVPMSTPNWVTWYHNLTALTGNVTTTTAFISGCDGGTNGVGPFSDARADPLVCNATVGSSSSGLAIVYEADLRNTVPNGGAPSDCLGTAIAARADAGAVNYFVARNRYFIDVSTSANSTGRPELYCASPDSPSKQPLLENVDDMQIWYGTKATTGAADRQVVRYFKAGKDNSTAGTINAVGGTEWDKVISVRICLLMRSAEPVLTGEDDRTYQPCDLSLARATSADNRLRRAYYTTATLRSKMAL